MAFSELIILSACNSNGIIYTNKEFTWTNAICAESLDNCLLPYPEIRIFSPASFSVFSPLRYGCNGCPKSTNQYLRWIYKFLGAVNAVKKVAEKVFLNFIPALLHGIHELRKCLFLS